MFENCFWYLRCFLCLYLITTFCLLACKNRDISDSINAPKLALENHHIKVTYDSGLARKTHIT